MVKEIQIANSESFALVDDDDFERVSKYKWHFSSWGVRNYHGFFLHRLVMNLGPVNEDRSNLVDHIDRNVLNNQKSNLRICNDSQNSANRGPQKNTSSKYKGVARKDNRWVANIRNGKQKIRIGVYKIEEDAAIAYDYYAKQLFKEFAYLNFPDQNTNDYYECVEKNRSKTEKTISKYRGVHKRGHDKYWSARIKKNKKMYTIGRFNSEIEAARAYDKTAIGMHGLAAKLNFHNFDYDNYVINPIITEYSSKYYDVCWCTAHQKWKICVKINGKIKYIGMVKDEIVAAEIADYYNVKHNNIQLINFPNKDYTNYPIHQQLNNKIDNKRSSKYYGVCWDNSKKKWSVSITIGPFNISGIRFNSEEIAARTYDYILFKLTHNTDNLNFPDSDYNNFDTTILSSNIIERINQGTMIKTEYYGVWRIAHNKWIAAVKINKKYQEIGYFNDILDAASTSDFWNYKFNGHKIRLNFPDMTHNIFKLAKK